MSFVESQFPTTISQGSSFGPAWKTGVYVTASGFEERKVKWTSQRCHGDALHQNLSQEEFETVMDWFMAMQGMANGFRFKDWGDFKSCGVNSAISATDQVIGTGDGTTSAFQLVKKYTQGLTYSRTIKKPVAGTVVAAIDGIASGQITTDTTTGIVTFDNNSSTVVNASSVGSLTHLNLSGTLSDGDSAYFTTFTGDWAALNNTRFELTFISGSTYSINYDSSSFAAYSSNGGSGVSLPQSGESVTAGFEFDVPVRFDTDEMISSYSNYQNFGFTLPIVEIKL